MALTKPKYKNRQTLGGLPEYLPAYCGDFDDIIDQINDLIDGDYTMTDLTLEGVLTVEDTTDSTSKDTGCVILEGGLGVEKAINSGTTITAGTRMFTGAGAVSTPGLVVGANDNGIYEISATQMGFSIGNALKGGFNSSGLFGDVISEQTTDTGVTVDSVLLKDGGVRTPVAVINPKHASFYPEGAQTDIAAGTGGAIPITCYLTTVNTDAGGDAFTLANASQLGQMKKILLVVDGGGDAVITVTTLTGGTTITMNDAGDYVILIWNESGAGGSWQCIENSGCTIA